MAENESGQEKTEQATPKRVQEAREEGDIARSKEFNTMFVTFTSALAFLALGDDFVDTLMLFIGEHLSISRALVFDTPMIARYLLDSLLAALIIIAPFLVIALLASLLGPMMVGGWIFSLKSISVKFDRLNPLTGIRRVFSLRSVVEMLKAVSKFFLIAVAAVLMIYWSVDEFMMLSREPAQQGIAHSAALFSGAFLIFGLVLFIIAAFDIPFQLWQQSKKLKMTRQELKDELKQSDGRPEIRSKIRSIQREMANRRMMQKVPEADVVIVNPTHYSVALKYDERKASAPILLAKGTDLLALKIREIAIHHKIPIFSAPPLARAIYYTTKLERQIPSTLYLAVAKVLAYIYQVKAAKKFGFESPDIPYDLDVPEEYKDDR